MTLERVVKIKARIDVLTTELKSLDQEWASIQANCTHPNLPKRRLGDTYIDMCPDCGFASYCYEI